MERRALSSSSHDAPAAGRKRGSSRSPSRKGKGKEERERDRDAPVGDVEKPNFKKSGALEKPALMSNGVELKYSEPIEARKSERKWRLYIFKGKDHIDTIPIHRQSSYLIGRERKVCDLPMDHGSISGQHAVLQYRQIISKSEYGDTEKSVKLYLIDLESSNSTYVNGEQIPTLRYYELKVGDVLKFGYSTREMVVMEEE